MTDEKELLENENLENENVILVDEDGEEHTFVLLDVIEVEGSEYAILEPVDEDGDEDKDEDEEAEAVILKITLDENNEEILVDIEDDDEWEKVADYWQEIMEEGDEE